MRLQGCTWPGELALLAFEAHLCILATTPCYNNHLSLEVFGALKRMEHIPSPHLPVFSRPKVPVLSSLQYDGLDFATFPQRHGFDRDLMLQGDYSQHTPSQSAELLQAWLYFGTLFEVLGSEFGASRLFVLDEAGFEHGLITTALLEDQLSKRLHSLWLLSHDDHMQAWNIYTRIMAALRTLCQYCSLTTVAGDDRPFASRWPLSLAVDMSLRTMGHYVTSSLYPCLMLFAPPDTVNIRFPVAYLSITQFAQAPWCPSEITMLTEHFSPCTFHYTSELSRTRNGLNHSSCTRRVCHARQINPAVYYTQHATPDCSCSHIGVPIDQVVSMLRKRQIPLLTIVSSDTDGVIRLCVEPYNGKQTYVAFSHIWSDGLGNPLHNTLPRCQIQRLKGLLNELSSTLSVWQLINSGNFERVYRRLRNRSVAFWLDTLCVPVSNSYQAERSIALELMKDTYDRSYQVLVLDKELESCDGNSPMESYVRVSASGWMRRLWTLQEGVLSRRLYAKFRDGFINLDDRENRRSPMRKSVEDMKVRLREIAASATEAQSVLMNMRFLRNTFAEKPELKLFGIVHKTEYLSPDAAARAESSVRATAIFEAFKASVYRSTSKKDDELICMASLLGWDVAGLQNTPLDDRMYYLMSMQRHLPEALIFLAGTRMKAKGWTWALNRFGNHGAVQLDNQMRSTAKGHGIVTSNGLVVDLPALMLPDCSEVRSCSDYIIWFQTDNPSDRSGYARITRHEEFQSVSNAEELVVSASGSGAEFTENIPEIADGSTRQAVLFHSSYDPLMEAVAAPAISIAIQPRRNINDMSSDSDGQVYFRHLAKLEYLGRDWEHADVFLTHPRLQVTLIPQHAHLTRRTWCVG